MSRATDQTEWSHDRESFLLHEFPPSKFCKRSLDILRRFSDWNEGSVRREIEELDYTESELKRDVGNRIQKLTDRIHELHSSLENGALHEHTSSSGQSEDMKSLAELKKELQCLREDYVHFDQNQEDRNKLRHELDMRRADSIMMESDRRKDNIKHGKQESTHNPLFPPKLIPKPPEEKQKTKAREARAATIPKEPPVSDKAETGTKDERSIEAIPATASKDKLTIKIPPHDLPTKSPRQQTVAQEAWSLLTSKSAPISISMHRASSPNGSSRARELKTDRAHHQHSPIYAKPKKQPKTETPNSVSGQQDKETPNGKLILPALDLKLNYCENPEESARHEAHLKQMELRSNRKARINEQVWLMYHAAVSRKKQAHNPNDLPESSKTEPKQQAKSAETLPTAQPPR